MHGLSCGDDEATAAALGRVSRHTNTHTHTHTHTHAGGDACG